MLRSASHFYSSDIVNQGKMMKERMITNGMMVLQDYLLPRSLTLRLAKGVLPPNTTIQKDAVLAIQKAATVFVSYLSSQYASSPSLSFPLYL